MNEDDNNLTEEDIRIIFGSEAAPVPAPPVESVKPEHIIKIQYQPSQVTDKEKYLKTVRTRTNGSVLTWFLNGLKTLAIFILIFTLSFTFLNYPALTIKTEYFWQVEQGGKTWNYDPVVTQALAKDNNLLIPKINVDVPINWNVAEEGTLPALETGVAHYKGTAQPGDIGNVFISGHSSYYWWNEGAYKEVFALLEKLEIGDKIYVTYQNKASVYEVTGKNTVKPDFLDALAQTSSETLSLMTCVPVGTSLNRLIVTAKKIQ